MPYYKALKNPDKAGYQRLYYCPNDVNDEEDVINEQDYVIVCPYRCCRTHLGKICRNTFIKYHGGGRCLQQLAGADHETVEVTDGGPPSKFESEDPSSLQADDDRASEDTVQGPALSLQLTQSEYSSGYECTDDDCAMSDLHEDVSLGGENKKASRTSKRDQKKLSVKRKENAAKVEEVNDSSSEEEAPQPQRLRGKRGRSNNVTGLKGKKKGSKEGKAASRGTSKRTKRAR